MIAILDYGLGNIRAFANIYNDLNVPVAIAADPDALRAADKLILPGVGSFDHAMRLLNASGMAEALGEQVVERGKPVLGVCVGMQMLADSSEEGVEPGLGWIGGRVRRMRCLPDSNAVRLPHMGWNTIEPGADQPLLAGLDAAFGFYFLHSYYFEPAEDESSIALANYGCGFTCAVRRGNTYGVQFHPEKSHHNGIRLLKNFAEL